MKKILQFIMFIGILTAVYRVSGFNQPLKDQQDQHSRTTVTQTEKTFDYYVLALSWQPAFCETHSRKPECLSQTDSRFDSRNFVLHGLWPTRQDDKRHTYNYCSVPQQLIKKDKAGRWHELPEISLSKSVRSQLHKLMPGSRSLLHRHEWYKHGTCSGLSANDYYALTNHLVNAFSATALNRYVAERTGQTVRRKKLLQSFERDFGQGTQSSLSLRCKKIRGQSVLTEIQVYLKHDLSLTDSLQQMLPVQAPQARGNCPSRFAIDAAGIQ